MAAQPLRYPGTSPARLLVTTYLPGYRIPTDLETSLLFKALEYSKNNFKVQFDVDN